ncbi:MAG: hypothetical protein IH599_06490, partial [Bacteroidales bacterium]|nr:hypothetical protein [Bacteroidales bacterium]
MMPGLHGILAALLGALLLLLPACVPSDDTPGTEIIIQDKKATGGIVLLEELLVREVRTIDSLTLSPGVQASFHLSHSLPGFYLLRYGDGTVLTLFIRPGEEVHVERIHDESSYGYNVKGSPGSEVLREYFLRRSADEQVMDSLGRVFRDSRATDDFYIIREKLDSQYFALRESHREWVFRYIMDNDTSLVSLFLLNQRFGREPVYTLEDAFGLMEHLDSMLFGRYPDNVHALDHHKRVDARRRAIYEMELTLEKLMPGKPAPELMMRDITDQEWRLGQMSGQPVLLHFWASTDALSRRDNRQLPSLIDKHPWLVPVSVSMDRQQEAWKAAVKLDALSWTQVSELL